MQLHELGAIQIAIRPTDKLGVMSVDVAAENRKDVIHNETQFNETPDQFLKRLKGIFIALWNSEVRITAEVPKSPAKPKVKAWEEHKAELTGNK